MEKEWLICGLWSQRCALPLESVSVVVRLMPLVAVASSVPGLMGVSRIRGVVTPVLDVGRLLFDKASSPARLVVIGTAAGPVALGFDEVVGVRSLSEHTADRLPPLMTGAPDALSGVISGEGELVFVLGGSRWLSEEVLRSWSVEGAA
jgi:chemotaxis signal transduction protein